MHLNIQNLEKALQYDYIRRTKTLSYKCQIQGSVFQ